MSEENLKSELKEIKISDNKRIDSISKEIFERSSKDVMELIKILHSGKEEESQKASILLMSLKDPLITPVISSLDKDNPDNYFWEMDIVLTHHLQNRNRIAVVLNAMLLDRRNLKNPELKSMVEEKPMPRRVCDEAYLMLRKLTAFKEDEETLMMNERVFLKMTDENRDKEIDRMKSSEVWISLTDHFFDQTE